MKHLAAYLLLGLGGNTSPSADDVKGVLSSVGIDADEERLDKLIDELKGKDLQEVCSQFILETFRKASNEMIAVDRGRFNQARIGTIRWRRWWRRCCSGGRWRRRCCCRRGKAS